MRELLRHRDFRLILAGQSLSMFGDWTLLLVFGIWGKSLTGSNAIAGLMIFAMAGPGLLGPLGGLLADRVRRRHLMVTLNVLSAGAVLLLWFVHDRDQLCCCSPLLPGTGCPEWCSTPRSPVWSRLCCRHR